MDEKQIASLVDEEIAKRHLAGQLEPAENPRWRFLRHPLMLTIVGFLLTVGIGGFYDSVLENRKQAAAERLVAMDAVHGLVQAAAERRERGSLVVSGIRRDLAPDRLHDRKSAYDVAYIGWNTNLIPRLSALRHYLDSDQQNDFEIQMNLNFFPWMGAADNCLTRAYDVVQSQAPDRSALAQEILANCNGPRDIPDIKASYSFSEISRALHGCEIAVVETLAVTVRRGIQASDTTWPHVQKTAVAMFQHYCRPDWEGQAIWP